MAARRGPDGPGRERPGGPEPLGARFLTAPDGTEGTNVAVWSGAAERVEVCLFAADGVRETDRVPLTAGPHGVWHAFLPGVRPGRCYGFRAHGRWDPWTGARYNPAKLLLDPYARAVDGEFGRVRGPDGGLPDEVFGHVRDWPDGAVADTVRDDRDSAPFVPKAVVVADDPAGPIGPDHPERPGTRWSRTVLYEAHVRGLTMLHPDVPAELRGSYAGLAHPAVLDHLRGLGVTAVELLPVQQFAHEEHVLRRGLRNHWGYNPVGHLAPHAGYAATGTRGEQVSEFRAMVRALHAAGLEVILDVVYNHTAEAGELGPTYSLRGLDNRAYYRLGDDPRRYADHTGCGNTLDAGHPWALRLVTDSLRHWVTAMGVDGFRFDLATALTRTGDEGRPDPLAPFLTAVAQDPVLRRVKLIAEPWDVGPDGYRTGGFPPAWSEWNDRFRDTARDFWRGAAAGVADLGYRLSGSSDLFGWGGRRPYASVNFVTAHDGFTLRDLVSYDTKHNEANGEDNRDGTDDNRSANCGAEGPTDDPAVTARRARRTRALLATLLLSAGVPMLAAGDEMGHGQGGNNNAYCHDDPTTWLDWSQARDPEGRELRDLTAALTALRRRHPALRPDRFRTGLPSGPGGPPDLAWFAPHGREMTEADWAAPAVTLGMYLSGRSTPPPWSADADGDGDPRADTAAGGGTGPEAGCAAQADGPAGSGGSAECPGPGSGGASGAGVEEDTGLLLVLHAGPEPIAFILPGERWASGYRIELDTSRPFAADPDGGRAGAPVSGGEPLGAGGELTVPGQCVLLLRAVGPRPRPGGGPREE